MTIGKLIEGQNRETITCAPDQSVREAARLLAENRIGCLPVIAPRAGEGGEVVGMFSERDLLYCIAREGGAVLDKPVSEVMTAPAITIDKDTDVLDGLSLMTLRRVRHLPVVEGGRMVGLVSIGDLVKVRMDHIEHEAQAMREYITQG